jgi:cytochrome c-type biogenesis protein CcmH
MPVQPSRNAAKGLFLIVLVLLLLAVLVNTAAAQSDSGNRTVTDDEVNEIARDIFCPVCESTPLDVCPTQACADWRQIIRTKLSEGQTEQQIKDYFEDQYGPRALAEPPREGFLLFVWIIPIAAVVVGGFFFTRYLRSLKTAAPEPTTFAREPSRPEPAPKPVIEPGQDDYTARIERELQKRTR